MRAVSHSHSHFFTRPLIRVQASYRFPGGHQRADFPWRFSQRCAARDPCSPRPHHLCLTCDANDEFCKLLGHVAGFIRLCVLSLGLSLLQAVPWGKQQQLTQNLRPNLFDVKLAGKYQGRFDKNGCDDVEQAEQDLAGCTESCLAWSEYRVSTLLHAAK